MIAVRANGPHPWRGPGIVLSAGMLLLTGCPQTQTPSSQPASQSAQPKTMSQGMSHATDRIHNLSLEAEHLTADAQQLPGHDSAEHSRLMQRVLVDLLQTLPLLADSSEDRVLQQRLSIIQTSRATLANSAGLAIEPTIDNALRAAGAALADVSHADGYEQADVGPSLDKLSAQLNRLDLSRDPNLHRVDVAAAVDLVSEIVNKLAAALSGRLTAAPATKPAS